ncbi:MAG: aryl-sulfate sulfotransferase, partial [Pseudobdellovibrio sp.]
NPQILENGNLLLFDNGQTESATDNRTSRVAEYRLDYNSKTAELVWEYKPSFANDRRSGAGSVQVLSNGNLLIGWGFPGTVGKLPENYKYPIFSEVDRAGNIVRTLTSTKNLVSYRVQFVENTKEP